MARYESLKISDENSTRIIVISRPEKLNALNKKVISELSEALKAAEADAAVRAIVLTGEGEKAFVAGADVAEFASFSKEEGKRLSADGQEKLFSLIPEMGTPVIAAVNGFALGGGLELAMSCHMRVASKHAVMGLPEVGLGVIPGYGGTQRLPRLVGRGRALEMILTAKKIDAEEAFHSGLVNAVVDADELIPACMKMAAAIARNSPTAVAAAIAACNAAEAALEGGYTAEVDAFGDCFDSPDFKEGTTAFLEKRKPQFGQKP